MTVGQIVAEPLRLHRSLGRPNAPTASRSYWIRSGCRRGPPGDTPPVGGRAAAARRDRARHRDGAEVHRTRRARLLAGPDGAGGDHRPADRPPGAVSITYLFIHDLTTVRYLCNSVAVMYLGKIVEMSATEELFERPVHPYTRALLSAVPIPDPEIRQSKFVLEGEIPAPSTCQADALSTLAAPRRRRREHGCPRTGGGPRRSLGGMPSRPRARLRREHAKRRDSAECRPDWNHIEQLGDR